MKLKLIAASVLALSSAAAFAEQAAESPWMLFIRAAHLSPANESSGVAGAGNAIHVESKTIPDISIRYSFSKNLAAELLLTVPQKHEVTHSTLGNLGTFKHLPPTLFAQYHFDTSSNFLPYVGAGINYTRISNVSLGGLQMDKSSWGGAMQVGCDYKLANNGVISVDLKKIYIESDVKAAGATIANVKVDPVVFSIGYGFHF